MTGRCPTRLPWYVAGILDTGSVREVDAHLRRCERCRGQVAALGASLDLEPSVSAHVPAADLVAYEAGSAGAAAPRARAHLAACESCRAELALLRQVSARTSRRATHWPAPRGLALAAAAAVVAVLLVPAALRSVGRSQPATVVLVPATRGASAEPVLPGRGPWRLTLVLPSVVGDGTFGVRITPRAGGGEVRHSARSSKGRLTVHVQGLGPPGAYTLWLEPADAVGAPFSYAFRLAEPAP
jgi:hypothetical protein